MKKIHYATPFILAFSVTATAQPSNINTLINKEVNKTIYALNTNKYNDLGNEFAELSREIVFADINNDGIKDAVVALHYCEKISCHSTYNSFYVAAFLGRKNGNYHYVDTYDTNAFIGNIKVANGLIKVTSFTYQDDNPTCCPTDKTVDVLKIVKNKLRKVI